MMPSAAVAEIETSVRPSSTRAAVELTTLTTSLPPQPDTVPCPACGEPAEVEWRDTAASTSGPVVHIKLRCPQGRHWFLMLEEDL